MASSTSKPIILVVPGEPTPAGAATRGAATAPLPAGLTHGRIKQSVRVSAARAGGGGEVRVTAVPGEDVVALHIAGGPALILHPETARDLMLAQSEIKRARGARTTAVRAPNEVNVPTRLQWRGLEQGVATRGATRGWLGDVVLSAIEVITGVATDAAADFVASEVVRRVDAQVDDGVYTLRPDTLSPLKSSGAKPSKVPVAEDGGPLLVFIHGTFSETHGTFSKLWTHHPQRVRSLFTHYHNRVYALDHATLGVSPIANALTLANALPRNAHLHLVTHSRGGLVAEVLARVCADPDDDFEPFAGKEYKKQLADLKALAALVKQRKIQVDRIVRVACPARGTLLASKRLDAYVSVFKWTLELAGVPVAPALVDFLSEVARRRADPELLPGLAAQIPDSPLVQWLHTVDEPIAGRLRVVAGDIEGDSVTSWLKTLLSDAFYWTDNDLVVQTRSMYGGAPRAAGASFVLDQGGKVSHFNYFANERTAEAVVNALVQEAPDGFRTIGPLSWAGESSTGTRAALRRGHGKLASEKPAVFVLPGILGSHLKVGGQRIWLSWRIINGLERLDYRPHRPDGVEPDGPIDHSYDDLADFLATTHDVIEFAFDWRKPIEEEARRLATAVEEALAAREKSGEPVRLLAHSMGGLVARTMQLERPDVWKRMMSRPGARLLMLGTPNAGSWAPMQVLSGDDTFGNTLAVFGAPFRTHAARDLMARFPGFLQLQASLLDSTLALDKTDTWKTLAEKDLATLSAHSWWHRLTIQLDAHQWGVPPQEVLDSAKALRTRLDAQRDKDLGGFKDRLLLVVGKATFTPEGYELGDDGLVYRDAPDDGDGRVTLASAVLPGVKTWTLDCAHGSLPDKKGAFEAYLQLLQNGTTNLLSPLVAAPVARGIATPTAGRVRSRPSRGRLMGRPPETTRDLQSVQGGEPHEVRAAPGTALHITVHNGDLTFVPQPLLLGHYRSTKLTGSERVMNILVGGAMEESIKLGLYPDPPGTHQVFVNSRVNPKNPLQMPRPEAVVVVGLGQEGKLGATELAHSVRQAVIAWAQRRRELRESPAFFELAATLIGSGGSGITVGQSARLIAQGVREANERLADREWPRVSHLHLIELYHDRATEAWRALQIQATAAPGHYVVTDGLQPGVGALRRPLDAGYRGADYDFITAQTQKGEHGDSLIAYTLDTKRARTEVRAQATQGPLLRELVEKAGNDQNSDTQIGRTLFQLLVPVEMEPFLSGTTEMQIELDRGTAGIPWELLDADVPGGGDRRPWAIRAKLLRKLRTADFRAQVNDADAESSVLVIGEPECDAEIYPRLVGARHEARAVAQRFIEPGALGVDKVKALISSDDPATVGPDARAVINALLERDWRIVHIAGHGEPPQRIGASRGKPGDPLQQDADPRGVVLSKGFLGPREIKNMRVVPELVFVNCCHLAARNADQLLREDSSQRGRPYDRSRFAAGVAEELINLGVRCVIAAGWAVDDAAASVFATTFYDAVLRGRRFIDAVGAAREAAFALGGNTWAAYQCYGDPDWTFRRESADAQRPTLTLSDEFAGVASSSVLRLALDTLAVKSKFQMPHEEEARARAEEDQRARIRHLEVRFASQWGGIGEVAEAFAGAYASARDVASAIRWYERAVAANDGSASLRATEQLGNLRAREALGKAEEAKKRVEGRVAAPAGTRKTRRTARRARDRDRKGLVRTFANARADIASALTLLERLADLHPSIERESLCGSAWKRKAMLEALAGKPRDEIKAIARMKLRYEKAEFLARRGQDPQLFYPALNRVAAELIVAGGKRGWKGLDAAAIGAIRQNLAAKLRDDPDFWSAVAQTELRVYEAVARGDLAGDQASILREYDDLHRRVKAPWMWASVYDQARFVLPKYGARATPKEQKAVKAVLTRLATLAGT